MRESELKKKKKKEREREELIKQTVKMNKILVFCFTIELQCHSTIWALMLNHPNISHLAVPMGMLYWEGFFG